LPILRSIFEWAASGLTIRAIILKLQSLGIPPRKSKRGVWHSSTLSKLLRNKTYIGQGHFGATVATIPIKPLKINAYKKNKKSSRRINPEAEWIKIPTPAIIDEPLFNRVQQQLKLNFNRSARNTKNEYLLAGKIYCTCGSKRTAAGTSCGKHLYYRCLNRTKAFPLPPTCLERGINAQIADDLVWSEMIKVISSPELLTNHFLRWKKTVKSSSPLSTIDIQATEREIKRLQEQEDRFLKAYGAEVISMEQLKANTEPIRGKITLLKNQIAKGEAETNSLENKYPSFELSQSKLLAAYTIDKLQNLNFNAKKEVMGAFINKVVGNRKQLIVSGYLPLEFVNQNVELCSNYMNGMNIMRQIDSIDYLKSIPFELTIAFRVFKTKR
jgi:site-specific DNA recombinase